MFYFDSAYVAKCYLNDPDSEHVRDMVRNPVPLYSSAHSARRGTGHSRRSLSPRRAGLRCALS
jgi:hypothetical protein